MRWTGYSFGDWVGRLSQQTRQWVGRGVIRLIDIQTNYYIPGSEIARFYILAKAGKILHGNTPLSPFRKCTSKSESVFHESDAALHMAAGNLSAALIDAVEAGTVTTPVTIPLEEGTRWQVILEVSADLVNWKESFPGGFAGNTPKRFFRTRLVKES
jgi:hypothetical protein